MNNKKRIFIAINLPKKVKEKLLEYRYDIPAIWTKKDNLHITLAFLGYIADEELMDIFKIAEDVASNNSAFSLKMEKISYGPKNRMVWAVGENSPSLIKLKQSLDNKLRITGKFSFHITLARIKAWDWQRIDPEDRVEISEDIDLNFKVESIEIMESVLKREGPEYTILQSYKLL